MGPKAVAQAFEIADGWLPIFWSPEKARSAFGDVIANAREGFDIAATAPVILIDDVDRAASSSSRTTRCTSAAWAANDLRIRLATTMRCTSSGPS